jgi:CheY-like chemotaxis protein
MHLVLLLDDNADLRGVLKEVIEVLGYKVIAVENGRAGLDVLQSRSQLPDIIICDINMPDIDGFAFLKQLRETPEWSQIFFAAMSGKREDRKPALEAGADEYMPKPFNVVELRRALQKFHDRTPPPTPAAEPAPQETPPIS